MLCHFKSFVRFPFIFCENIRSLFIIIPLLPSPYFILFLLTFCIMWAHTKMNKKNPWKHLFFVSLSQSVSKLNNWEIAKWNCIFLQCICTIILALSSSSSTCANAMHYKSTFKTIIEKTLTTSIRDQAGERVSVCLNVQRNINFFFPITAFGNLSWCSLDFHSCECKMKSMLLLF